MARASPCRRSCDAPADEFLGNSIKTVFSQRSQTQRAVRLTFVSSLMPDSHPPSPHGDVPASQPTSSTLNINTLADFAASLPPSLRGLDPSVLVSMLTALTTGQSNTPVALPQPETGHNSKLMVCADIDVAHHAVRTSLAVTIRTHSPAVPMSQVRHLVPPEALPPSPTMARLAQPVEYPTGKSALSMPCEQSVLTVLAV